MPRPRSTYKLTTSQLLYRPNSIWASFSQKGGIEMKKKKLSRLLLFYFYFIFFDFFLVPFVCRRWIIHWKPPAGLMSRYPLVGWASNQTHTTFQYIQGGLKGTKLFSFSLSLSVCVCVCWLYYVISKPLTVFWRARHYWRKIISKRQCGRSSNTHNHLEMVGFFVWKK